VSEPRSLARNDIRQYEDLAEQWWEPSGPFAALHWIAASRAELIPPAPSGGGLLLDVACGGGLLAPLIAPDYRHVGVDLVPSALVQAAEHGVQPLVSDAAALPFADAAFDVVVAGEILEHLDDPDTAVAEICRVTRPGGWIVIDTIADTRWAGFALVTIAERLPGGPPPRCHDRERFVDPDRLRARFDAGGVEMRLHGLVPAPFQYLRFVATGKGRVRMRRTRSLSALYAGLGQKRPAPHAVERAISNGNGTEARSW
jgi:2-polyprenyl-6-hydroxyphenyl methylase / 3-demethylubiquinone-9 3-methyltransferase